MTRTVDRAAEAALLVAELLDRSRRAPVLGVAVPDAASAAQVDTEGLAALLPHGEVRLLVGPEATWELKRGLPTGLDVYGRAARLWWPSAEGLALVTHPLALLDEQLHVDSVPLTGWLTAQLARGPSPAEVPPAEGVGQQAVEQQAVVLEVDACRAVVRLADGATADLTAAAFAGAGRDATRLLRVAQTLRVRVSRSAAGHRSVTPVHSPAGARQRLREQCPVGSTVWGRVLSVRASGARVSLLPGVVGMLHVSELADGRVRHPEDHLSDGEVLAVRILAHEGERVALSLLGADDQPLSPALLPDGPPWVPAPEPAHFVPQATELPTGRGFGDAPAQRPPGPDDVQLLHVAVRETREVRDELLRTASAHEQYVTGLRAEARQLLRDLERDLADARERVLSTTSGAAALAGSTELALQTAREEVERLRRALRTLTEQQAALQAQASAATSRAERAERTAEEHRRSAEQHARTAASLRSELERYAPASRRLVDAIRASWIRTTTPADRERHPWREPVVGPGFLDSLDRVEGVSLERVHDICAEVVCGRAALRSGLAVHPLRATDASGSPQQTREDGALAFRASLQSRTSAARRLHFWQLPDGRVELAKIGYHDDFTI